MIFSRSNEENSEFWSKNDIPIFDSEEDYNI